MSLMRRADFPSLLENFFGRDIMDFDGFTQRSSNMPAVNIKENEHEFQIDVAAPGMKKEDFKLNLDNNVLTISSEKELKNEEKDEQGNYTRREFSYQSFTRSFSLPEMVNADQIKANYNDGILRISLPKKEEARQRTPRSIDIS
jgi:HSP20 family protein